MSLLTMAYALSVPRRFIVLLVSFLITAGLFLGYRAHVRPGEGAPAQDVAHFAPDVAHFAPPAEGPKPAVEIFPAALDGHIPQILEANRPPKSHHPTPLFIGFTRNWPILQQSVVSYITAGWPAADIYVIDNTGTMESNELGLLTMQNPFYLDYPRLKALGVNVIIAPTLLSFAQLQNFFLFTAIRKKWGHYYWSHMDSAVLSHEETEPYKSLYQRIIDNWKSIDKSEKWAIKFFEYDHLALVNVAAYQDAGGWDTQIPFYMTDCDFHARLYMKNYTATNEIVGDIFDVGGTVPDLSVFYPASPTEPPNSERYKYLRKMLDKIQRAKVESKDGRNLWQTEQRGGKGEPYYRNPEGFEKALHQWIQTGRNVFADKWGHRECDIFEIGKEFDKAWEYEKDWWV